MKAAWEAVDTLAKKSICLRRTFQVGDAKEGGANRKPGKKIVEATAYVCGLGFYEFSLNGQKVGNSEFAPLWSDYDKTVYYNTYDVTEQLRRGENVVGILLGNGFYNVQGGGIANYRSALVLPHFYLSWLLTTKMEHVQRFILIMNGNMISVR